MRLPRNPSAEHLRKQAKTPPRPRLRLRQLGGFDPRGCRDVRDTLWRGTPLGWAAHEGRQRAKAYLRSLE